MSSVPSNANAGCVGPKSDKAGTAAGCAGCPNQKACSSGAGKATDPSEGVVGDALGSVEHKLLVLSGKGGVGKSTVACQLAFTLALQGHQVGLLDVDICGPSVPRMLGIVGREVHQSGSGWTPISVELPGDNPTGELLVMSIGFMLPNADDAIIWRGPRKNGLIKQFLTDVDWGTLDYLIIDTPPGTSDEHLSIIQYLRGAGCDGAVVVTTPQEVSMQDVRKEINFCKKTSVPVLGVIENMSSFTMPLSNLVLVDPESGEDRTAAAVEKLQQVAPELLDLVVSADIFPAFGAGPAGMAEQFDVQFLGRLPLDRHLMSACEQGQSFLAAYPESQAAAPLTDIVQAIKDKIIANADVLPDADAEA